MPRRRTIRGKEPAACLTEARDLSSLRFVSNRANCAQIMLVIRLSRTGRKKQPYYRLVVAEKSAPIKGRHIEVIGNYNPRTKDLQVDVEKAKARLANGAQPSETAEALLEKAGVLKRDKITEKNRRPERKPKKEAEPEEAPKAEADGDAPADTETDSSADDKATDDAGSDAKEDAPADDAADEKSDEKTDEEPAGKPADDKSADDAESKSDDTKTEKGDS